MNRQASPERIDARADGIILFRFTFGSTIIDVEAPDERTAGTRLARWQAAAAAPRRGMADTIAAAVAAGVAASSAGADVAAAARTAASPPPPDAGMLGAVEVKP
jgi:hypothetical protein